MTHAEKYDEQNEELKKLHKEFTDQAIKIDQKNIENSILKTSNQRLWEENDKFKKQILSMDNEIKEVINMLRHWIHGDNMKSESIRFLREHGDNTIFK